MDDSLSEYDWDEILEQQHRERAPSDADSIADAVRAANPLPYDLPDNQTVSDPIRPVSYPQPKDHEWEEMLRSWYTTQEIEAMKDHYDSILLYVRESAYVQSWRNNRPGLALSLHTDNPFLCFERYDVTLRTAPDYRSPLLLGQCSREVLRVSHKVIKDWRPTDFLDGDPSYETFLLRDCCDVSSDRYVSQIGEKKGDWIRIQVIDDSDFIIGWMPSSYVTPLDEPYETQGPSVRISPASVVRSGQEITVLAYTRNFALVTCNMEGRCVLGWISIYHLGGPWWNLPHQIPSSTLNFNIRHPSWCHPWWWGCTDADAGEYNHLICRSQCMSVEFEYVSYKDLAPHHKDIIESNVRNIQREAQSSKFTKADLETIEDMFQPSGCYIYAYIAISEGRFISPEDLAKLRRFSSQFLDDYLVTVQSRHKESTIGLHISLFHIYVRAYPDAKKFRMKMNFLQKILQANVDGILNTPLDDLLCPREAKASITALTQGHDCDWDGMPIYKIPNDHIDVYVREGLLASLDCECQLKEGDGAMEASRKRWIYLHDRDERRILAADRHRSDAISVASAPHNRHRLADVCTYERNGTGLDSFDPITKFRLFLVLDAICYRLHLHEDSNCYDLSYLVPDKALHITDQGPWRFRIDKVQDLVTDQ